MKRRKAWTCLVALILVLSACGVGDRTMSTDAQAVLTVAALVTSTSSPVGSLVISGIVIGEDGPLADAVVRIQTTRIHTISGEDGSFTLKLEDLVEETYNLTGWASGYYCSGPFEAVPGEQDIVVDSSAMPTTTIRNIVGSPHVSTLAWARIMAAPNATAGRAPTCPSRCLSMNGFWTRTLNRRRIRVS